MASMLVTGASVALRVVLPMLGELLANEGKLLRGVSDEIRSLKKDLSWMQAFLKDAEDKLDGDGNNLIREWVSDVKDLADKTEDAIETFTIKFGSKTRKYLIFNRLYATHKFGSHLRHLKKEAENILRRRIEYGLTSLDTSNRRKTAERLKVLRESSSDIFNEFILGRVEAVEHLLKELRDGESGCFILSIHGMGGLGKTTLARKLFREFSTESVKLRAWICVSETYTAEDLLKRLILSIANEGNEVLDRLTTLASMKTYLRNAFDGSSFVLVLDDVWDNEAWKSICDVIPNDITKGRVIITTRNMEVAKANSAYVYELKNLHYDDSWKLFCQTTFKSGKCPQNLLQLGKEMVRKCDGLPLAIVALGGLLSTKFNDISQWEAVKSNFWKDLGQENPLIVDAILSLSFMDLPHHLRPCLLYVAMFPADSEISIMKLIIMWEAEGFASLEESKLYFKELVGRSLLHTKCGDWLDSTCRVHGLVRDLVIKKAKDASFSGFYGVNEKFSLSDTLTQRRLALCNMDFNTIPFECRSRSLRTMHLLSSYGLSESQFSYVSKSLQPRHGQLDMLRVLDIKVGGKMPYVNVGKMIHLRYLGLESSETFKVSKSLGDLKLLETLYVSSMKDTVKLPKTVAKLRNLKHLLGCFCSTGAMGVCIGKLKGLRALEINDCVSWCDLDTSNLVNLRHLSVGTMAWATGVETVENCTYKKFLPNFENLPGLQTINLAVDSVYEVSEILRRCPRVTHFESSDTSTNPDPSRNPDIFAFGTHLEVIEWVSVRIWNFQSSISSLEKLPRLRVLRLSVCDCVDVALSISEDAFPQLQSLYIILTSYYVSMQPVSMELCVKETGMPMLRKLYVDAPECLKVPDKLKPKIIRMH